MSLRWLFVAATALGCLIAAQAEAQVTTAAVNLRTGPGASYAPILAVPAGINLVVHRCSPRWCNVSVAGRRGWVAANFVSGTGYNRNIGVPGPTPGCLIPRNYVLYAQGTDKRATRGCPLDFYTFAYGSKPYFDSQYYHSSWRPRGFGSNGSIVSGGMGHQGSRK